MLLNFLSNAAKIKQDGSELLYGYDDAGNRTTLSTVVVGITNTAIYSFDALNRIASVADNDGNTTSYTFDANSNQTRIDQANNTATTMEFDDLNRVTTITHLGTAGETLTSLTYTLDDTGRRTAINESSGRSSNYTYDELYRLTGETITDNEVGNHSASYTYNAVSNRIADTVNGTSSNYSYDENDRITAHGQDSYSYDDNGNTITEVVNGQSNSYTYGSQNRLIEANMGGVVQAMAYDPDGVRIQKSTNGNTIDYLVDSNRDYAQVLYERSATSELNYTFGTDLVGLSTGVENFTYHTDALDSTRLLTNDAGEIADDVRYDAWGEKISGGDVLDNQYLYTGEQFDGGLGKTYLRARYYDTKRARFTQADAWMGIDQRPITLNKYVYGNANPVLMTDPSGNFSIIEAFAALNVQSQMLLVTGATVSVGTIMYGTSQSETMGNPGANSRGWGVWDIVARNRFTAAMGITGTGVVAATNTKTQRMNDGHHTIPIYLCGGDDQEKSLLDQKSHAALHAGLRAIQVSMHSAEAAADRMISFKGVRTASVLSLADSEIGRGIIASGIHGYYSIGGWMQRGVRPIGMIFPTERVRYVSGENTSLGNPEVCKRTK